jgi:hypothetical protein
MSNRLFVTYVYYPRGSQEAVFDNGEVELGSADYPKNKVQGMEDVRALEAMLVKRCDCRAVTLLSWRDFE